MAYPIPRDRTHQSDGAFLATLNVCCDHSRRSSCSSRLRKWRHAQQDVIAGIVRVSGSERALPGAQITITGQPTHAAVSDAAGKFRITGVTGTQVTLNARIIGYRPETQTVNVGNADVRFTRTERALELDQMVVTGTAGGAEKRTIGTAVASVPVSDRHGQDHGAERRRSPQWTHAGSRHSSADRTGRRRRAGSRPRHRQRSRCRAIPLLYVDGVRVNNGSDGIVTRLNDFDPEEIENIEVLKGPAAATLYGTRSRARRDQHHHQERRRGFDAVCVHGEEWHQLVHGRRKPYSV